MIADLKPYPEYKESGQEWLGEVPSHWEIRRLRASINDCTNGVWGGDPNGKDDLFCVRVADFDRIGLRVSLRKKTMRAIPVSARSTRMLQRGDLLLEKSGGGELQPVGVVVAYTHDEPAVCSNFVARMSIAEGYNSFFVNYLHATLYAKRINVLSIKQTTGIQNLDGKAYLSESVAYPPTAEQATIVRFLDHWNGRLEKAIRSKRRVIALLQEQKQAIIHRAVTRGLDPNVKLKDSGIPWLGEIPEHWEVRRAKYLFREVDERSKDGDEELLSVSHLTGVTPRSQKNITMFKAESYEGHKLCRPGDLVVNTMWAWMGAMGVSEYTGIISPAYAVYRSCSDGFVGPYVDHLLRTQPYIANIICRSTGLRASRLRLYPDEFFRLPLILPPVEEQRAILHSIAAETHVFTTAIAGLEREITLLREYRTRLTADVVTGKLDVRTAAAQLPDSEQEPAVLEAPEEECELEEVEG